MAVQYITKDEFEQWRDNLTGFFRTTIDETVRRSEQRLTIALKAEIQDVRTELKAEIQEARAEAKADNAKTRKDLLAELKEIRLEFRDEDKALRRMIQGVRDQVATLQEHYTDIQAKYVDLQARYIEQGRKLDWMMSLLVQMALHMGLDQPPQP